MRVFLFLAAAAAATAASALDGRRHLTPVLQSGGDVRSAAKVGPLPGINATSYAGFFEVNASAHAEHFFWHWPSLNGNTSAPVVVWLQVSRWPPSPEQSRPPQAFTRL
jgi:hypothetical protein